MIGLNENWSSKVVNVEENINEIDSSMRIGDLVNIKLNAYEFNNNEIGTNIMKFKKILKHPTSTSQTQQQLTEFLSKLPDQKVAEKIKANFESQIQANESIDTEELLVSAVFEQIIFDLRNQKNGSKDNVESLDNSNQETYKTLTFDFNKEIDFDPNDSQIDDELEQGVLEIFSGSKQDEVADDLIEKFISYKEIEGPLSDEQKQNLKLKLQDSLPKLLESKQQIVEKTKLIEYLYSKKIIESKDQSQKIDLEAIVSKLNSQIAENSITLDEFTEQLSSQVSPNIAENINTYIQSSLSLGKTEHIFKQIQEKGDYQAAFSAMQSGGKEWEDYQKEKLIGFTYQYSAIQSSIEGEKNSPTEKIQDIVEIDRSFPPEKELKTERKEIFTNNPKLNDLPPVIKKTITDSSESKIRTSDRGILIILEKHKGTQIFIGNNGQKLVIFDKDTDHPYMESASKNEDIERLIDQKNASDYIKKIGLDSYFPDTPTAAAQKLDFLSTLSAPNLQTTDTIKQSQNNSFWDATKHESYLNEMFREIFKIQNKGPINFSSKEMQATLKNHGLLENNQIKPIDQLDSFIQEKIDYDQKKFKESPAEEQK